eukprot:CAMPEP_0201511944 /NCGR_PEP_ID=MMETSP0161_2-20130828/4305_1 /ASSEMBLY_ACC=CAM_ASM_000251 /TAXON_ID=180227 /ORGANISM="Neoparamoeba aestuarina, Strain SoJaBio B1-5/56/2" /LENGTH=282 /DNA_ID=CAMNT_0047907619 /DNA_START=158 /DNA_END=1006 /DNA_ORIENTATION=-
MADPFSDIDGIVEAKESEVPIKESALLQKKTATEGDESIPYIERFPRRCQEKANNDLKSRLEMEQAFQATMVELHNVREQLYLVRFDDLRETEELRKDVQNYLAEIERLDAKISQLKEKMMESYIKSLNLETISVAPPQLKTTQNQAPHMGPGDHHVSNDKFGRAMSRHDLEVTGSAPFQSLSPGLLISSITEESLLRKYSFGLLGVKTPATQATSPQSAFLQPDGTVDELSLADLERRKKLSPDEIASIRATLYSLRQKKELTGAEANLVEVLTAKLRQNE